jgi:hypothetical protein
MENHPNNSELDDVLNALAVSNIKTPVKNKKIVADSEKDYDEKDILNRALKGLDELIESNAWVLEEARRLVESTGEVAYIESFSSLSKSQSEAYKNIVQIITNKEKNKVLKETKEKEIAVKEKLVDHQIGELEHKRNNLPSGSTLNQTNVIMSGSREEALELLKRLKVVEKEEAKTIEV